MTTVVIRADGGPGVGLGHVQRCLALAEALSCAGIGGWFVAPDAPAIRRRLTLPGWVFEPEAVSADERGTADDADHVLGLASRHRCGAIVVDSYRAGASYFAGLRAADITVAVFDDLAIEAVDVDIVINGGAHAAQMSYSAFPASTTLLLGTTYAPLRREFWDVPRRVVRTSARHLVVTLGGSASPPLLAQVVEAVESALPDVSIDVVGGPFTAAPASLARARRHRELGAPLSLRAAFEEADVVVCGGGQTLYELAALGVPAVAVQMALNQRESLLAMETQGTIACAGDAGAASTVPALSALTARLCGDYALRSGMSVSGQHLVDGRGALRIAHVLVEQINARGTHSSRRGFA